MVVRWSFDGRREKINRAEQICSAPPGFTNLPDFQFRRIINLADFSILVG
jgi:hypothetical protein